MEKQSHLNRDGLWKGLLEDFFEALTSALTEEARP